jgi:hypothetical protein
LGGGAEEFADALPGDALGAGGVDDLTLASCSGEGGSFEEVFLDGTFVTGQEFVALDSLCELLGVVEELLDRPIEDRRIRWEIDGIEYHRVDRWDSRV